MRWVLGFPLIILLLVAGISLLFPSPVEPIAWTPDPDPGLTGPFAPNDRLAGVDRLLAGSIMGPEDVACGSGGELYTGLDDGRIVRVLADGSYRELTNTGGRPLGMELAADGRLIVADARRGLLAVSPLGIIELLTDSVDGRKLLFPDDLDIAADGRVWFSNASDRFGYRSEMYDFLEGRPSGSLLSYDPDSGETQVHLEGLFFANGVAMGPNDDYVLVNETGAGRIIRLWLKGGRAGQQDVFKAALPGTPDNISFNGSDTFWVALPALRAALDQNAGRPWLRKFIAYLPIEVLRGFSKPYSFVLGLGLDGAVKHNLQDTAAGFNMITSATECDGALYLGSLSMDSLARYPLE